MAKNTKQVLADSLFRILDKKPLDKIRISDLTEDCHVNRQTFYYHFHDIFELIEWIYVSEAKQAIGRHRTYGDWTTGMKDLCELMLEQKSFIMKTYHSSSHGNLEKVLSDSAYTLIYNVVKEKSKGYVISDDACRFIADFYKFSFSGMILEWIDRGMILKPDELVACIARIMHGNLEDAIIKFSTDPQT